MMMATGQEPPWFRELYNRLLGYQGHDSFGDVLSPWLPKAKAAASHLADFRQFFVPTLRGDDFQVSLWNLYALSRVNDFLLLSFQDDGRGSWSGPRISQDQYADFFEQVGFALFSGVEFSPFRHEIVEVAESANDNAFLEIAEPLWPGLMFGNLLFSRSGVRVRGGRNHIAKAVAERSTIYFTHRRLHRKTEDLSMGWGSNSQWRTSFRRDYEHDGFFRYNVDGKVDLTDDSQFDDREDDLSARERIELCKNRCFIVSTRSDADLCPYDYQYWERKDAPTEIDANWFTWNDGIVRRLAESIHQDHTYDRLPILADALEDAGCLDGTMLKHCREPVTHGPRCWAVEYLLGKG